MGNRFYKTVTECKKAAIEIIENFIEEELPNRKLLNLKDFSFWKIKNNIEFGNGKKYPDGDCTKIVYAIDYLLYSDYLKQENGDFFIPGFPYKTYADFSGETIFTYNTLFGKTRFKSELESHRKDFYYIYQYLGNFTLLPSKTKKIKDKYHSINTWKGDFNNSYHDYFFLYLVKAKEILGKKVCDDNDLKQLFEINPYFNNKTYEDYLRDFKLSDYNFDFIRDEYYFHWNKNINKEKYESFCLDYIEYASAIIKKRTSDLVDQLNHILFESPDFKHKEYLYEN